MRVLVVNPNTTRSVTDRVVAAASAVAAPGTALIPLTAPRGVPYISSRAEAAIGAAVALEMMAEHECGADGAILAAFGDPGLFALRELFEIPVVGMAEAGMMTACLLGRRFSIVSFSKGLGPWYRECVDMHQLGHRLASIRLLDGDFGPIQDVPTRTESLLVELANQAVEQDGADVVVLAGAPLAGLAPVIRDRVHVPVVDGAEAACKQIEALVSLRVCKASWGSFKSPPAKPSTGLPVPLQDKIGGAYATPESGERPNGA